MATPHGANVRGAFPVFDTSGNVNLFARTLQNQQAKRQQEEKLLQDELAKIKVDGVRQGDIPEFTNKYNQWKDSYGKLQGERDPAKKIQLRRDFDKTQLELQQLVNDSKTLAKGEDEFGKMLLNPNIRDRYKEDAVTQFQKSRNLSRNDPNFVRDLSKLQHQIDLSKIMQDLDKEDAEVMSISRFNDPTQREYTQGNRKGVLTEQSRDIDPQKQALRYANKFDLDPTFRVAVRELYPDLAELPNEKLKEAVVPRLVAERQRTEYKPQVFKEDEPYDNWKEKADYREKIRANRPPSAGAAVLPTYRQDVINRALNAEEGSGEEIFDAVKSGVMASGGTLKENFKYSKGKDGTISITIPTVYGKVDDKGTEEIVRGKTTFKYNPKKREEGARVLNSLMNIYTGEKIPFSATLTPSGKKKVPGGQGEESFKENKGTVRVSLNGQIGEIPVGQLGAFMKKYPKAKRL